MDYNIREMTIGDYEEALTLTICDLLFIIVIPHGQRSCAILHICVIGVDLCQKMIF